MKTNKLTTILSIVALVLIMAACDLIGLDKLNTKELSADDAKVEIRAANQEIISQKDEMLSSYGFRSVDYLMEIMNEDDLKSALLTGPKYAQRYSLTKIINAFRNNKSLKSVKLDENEYYGILEYNFDYNQFDQVAESDKKLEMNYPADELSHNKQLLNAVMTISELEFTQIPSTEEVYDWETDQYITRETTEEIPTNAEVELRVDDIIELAATYSGEFTADGLPTLMKMGLESGDYTMKMSYTGSSTAYKTSLEHKFGKDLLMGYDLDVKYTSDMNTVETITGSYTINPLKFKGTVNSYAIETAMEEADTNGTTPDIEYMNSQIDVDVIQIDENAKIGKLQYMMQYDAEWDSSSPELVILYEDGTSEWLTDVITILE